MVNKFLQQMQSRQVDQTKEATREQRSDQAAQDAIAKKAQLQKQIQTQHQASQQLSQVVIGRDERARWTALEQGRGGPELQQLATSPELQQKLNDKLKSMMADAADKQPAQAAQAATTLVELSQKAGFGEAVPDAQSLGDLGTTLLRSPKADAKLREALDHPFMASPDGDAPTKQRLLKFASRQVGAEMNSRGVSVRMGGNMLESLRQGRVPKFGQRAGMAMIERDPDNTVGVSNLDEFVHSPPVRNMPQNARGYAAVVLAKGDGDGQLKDSLTQVAGDPAFRAMGRENKEVLFKTIGEGRGSALRAITDQTLVALRSGRFVTQPHQVSRLLTTLGRQVASGDGTARDVNPRVLLRQARQSGLPRPPTLISTEHMSDEEAEMARRSNRASVMTYYNKLSNSQGEAEQLIDNAKWFEQINTVSGIREPTPPDLSALSTRESVRVSIDSQLSELRQSQSRQLPRVEQINQLKALETKMLADPSLTTDERTYVLARSASMRASATSQDMARQKARKSRELARSFMPPSRRRALMGERRPQGMQANYFRATLAPQSGPTAGRAGGGGGALSAEPRAPAAAASRASRQAARSGAAQRGGAEGQAAAQRSEARAPRNRAEVRRLVAELDPKLSVAERMQQATEIISQRIQSELRGIARQVAEELVPGAAAADPLPTSTETAPGSAAPARAPITSGSTDAYGIPRSQERDLGARRDFRAVRPKDEAAPDPTEGEEVSTVRARDIVRSNTTMRPLQALWTTSFADMTRAESAVFRTLGWNAPMWESKQNPGARVPMAYATRFAKLNASQKQAVRLLGLSEQDWDAMAHSYQGSAGPVAKK